VSLALDMMTIFSGAEDAYGIYELDGASVSPGEKAKGRASTIRGEVTETLWEAHIKGRKALGIVPIKTDNNCVWGVIDIDDYTLDIVGFSKRIYSLDLPLIPMRTKSGGCHLAVFLNEPVAASILQSTLQSVAASLGYGKSEIFPKQSQVLRDRGDVGNWLNMPYFGGNKSNRYALNAKGEAMKLEEFITCANGVKISQEELKKIEVIIETPDLKGGPPCLQVLVKQGFPEGTRNNGLFALGVYCRKAHPDDWGKVIEELNSKYMMPPLESKEVQAITKQLGRKSYTYKCNDQPIVNYCNSQLCRIAEFGIGGDALPTLENLRKLPTDQPVWFLEVNKITIELSTDQLLNIRLFRKACADALTVHIPMMNEAKWSLISGELLKKCEELAAPPGASIGDQFLELLYTFCSDSRLKALDKDELLLGRPWTSEVDGEARVHFRLRDIEEFLVRNGFKYYSRTQITSRLNNIGAENLFMRVAGRGVNLWHIPEPEAQIEPFKLPQMKGDVL